MPAGLYRNVLLHVCEIPFVWVRHGYVSTVWLTCRIQDCIRRRKRCCAKTPTAPAQLGLRSRLLETRSSIIDHPERLKPSVSVLAEYCHIRSICGHSLPWVTVWTEDFRSSRGTLAKPLDFRPLLGCLTTHLRHRPILRITTGNHTVGGIVRIFVGGLLCVIS